MKVDLKQFCKDYDAVVVVVSRDRADTLAEKTDLLFTDYVLAYSGEGYEDHDYHCSERIEVPRGLQGLSLVRNYILDLLPQNVVLFVDDDLHMVYWVASSLSIRMDREGIKLAVMDLIVHALDQKVAAFGMSPLDIRKSSPLNPFALRAVFGTVIGVVGREHRFDERNILKTDYDFCLMTMKSHRIVHLDMRYFATSSKDAGSGGNMTFRTNERRQREIDNLVRWWGPDVVIPSLNKSNESLMIRVDH